MGLHEQGANAFVKASRALLETIKAAGGDMRLSRIIDMSTTDLLVLCGLNDIQFTYSGAEVPKPTQESLQDMLDDWDADETVEYQSRVYTSEYREAPSGRGPHAAEWLDKPHRLVYDLCTEVDRLRMEIQALREKHENN